MQAVPPLPAPLRDRLPQCGGAEAIFAPVAYRAAMAAQLLLILGVDGAGKNHVANVGAAALAAAGHRVVTRSGYLSARDRPVTSSEDKGRPG